MIVPPYNDHECLGVVTEYVEQLVLDRDPTIVELARQLRTVDALVTFLRGLPQRNDESDLLDGPKVGDCAPPQRLRIPAPDPNCFERAALYLAVAELIDPVPARQLATSETDRGPHTVPREDGEVVILDPMVPRNAIEGGLFRHEPGPVPRSVAESMEWAATIAEEPASAWPGGERRVRNAREVMRGLRAGVPVTDETVADIAFAMALAAREATRWGAAGREMVRTVMRALCELQAHATDELSGDTPLPESAEMPRNPEPRIGNVRNRSALSEGLGALVRTAGRVGTAAVSRYGDVGVAAVGMYLAGLGVTPVMLAIVEQELRSEGLTLGALAKPAPKPGTVAAVTPVGRAARAIAAQAPDSSAT